MLTDFAATAILVRQLDVVISICTSVAHLAGIRGETGDLIAGRGLEMDNDNDSLLFLGSPISSRVGQLAGISGAGRRSLENEGMSAV